jgi:hypothetical protein
MTRPIVERVVRSGSRTALRLATTLDGSRPSSRLNPSTTRGMTNLAPMRNPVPEERDDEADPRVRLAEEPPEGQHRQPADDAGAGERGAQP